MTIAIWPDAAETPTNPTTTYTLSGVTFAIGEQEQWLFGKLTIPAGGTGDPGVRILFEVTVDGGTTWFEHSRVDIQNVAADALVDLDYVFEVRFPTHCTVRASVRDMGGDADTTLSINGTLRAWSVGLGKNDQPLELESVQTEGALAWHNAGAAEAVGNAGLAVSTSGTWIPVGEATEMVIQAVTTGGPPTSLEMDVQETTQDIAIPTVFASLPVVNTVIAGNVNTFPGEEQLQSAAGTLADNTYMSRPIAVRPGTMIRLRAERTGAAVNLLARVKFYKV